MSATRLSFTPDEVSKVVAYLETLRQSEEKEAEDFYTLFLAGGITGRLFFEIRAEQLHPAADSGKDSQLDIVFKKSPAQDQFNEDMQKIIALLATPRLEEKYRPKIEDMTKAFFQDIEASSEWKTFFEKIPPNQQARLKNRITTSVIFKLFAAWCRLHEKDFRPEELMTFNIAVTTTLSKIIGEVAKEEVAKKQKEMEFLTRLHRGLRDAAPSKDKTELAEEAITFLEENHLDDFKTSFQLQDKRGFLLAIAKAAFETLGQNVANANHKVFHDLYQARTAEVKEHGRMATDQDEKRSEQGRLMRQNSKIFASPKVKKKEPEKKEKIKEKDEKKSGFKSSKK